MEMTQMNTRLGAEIKRAGDEVLKRYGYTPSSAVQALWTYVVENNALPSFMPPKAKVSDLETRKQEVADDAGFVTRFAIEAGILSSDASWLDDLDYDELREEAWEERGAFRE